MHSPPLRPSSLDPGGLIPGTRYRALQQIGARGDVYTVEHLELGRRFVLRLVRAELAHRPEVLRRARADWQALSKLRHPSIARVTDAGTTARGVPYYVTEHLRGETLRQRLMRRRSLTVPEALGIARELASALLAAHAIGVVHGNVEPNKIFLPLTGGSKLFDFGMAELYGGLLHPDTRGVGLVLFEMIAGRSAFGNARRRRGRNPRRESSCPRLLAEVVPGVSTALSQLVARLLGHEARDPPSLLRALEELRCLERRYQDQVSTTQETAHYVTRRMPFLVGTASLPSEVGLVVPLPSQTLEGIPWTVTHVHAHAHTPPPAHRTPKPVPALALLAPAEVRAAPPLLPPRQPPALNLVVPFLLVMSCALVTGAVVTSLARRSIADETAAPRLDPSAQRDRRPAACSCWAEPAVDLASTQ